jgi:pyruvate dehydrogenase E2 component (dihydrolipoamide acetyltransferase)
MADVSEVAVPDIGDFTDVPVVEVHVEPGAAVAVDDPLVTLETDKASMDVPAPVAGTVEAVLIGVGDTASQGTPVARIALSGNGASADGGGGGGADAAASPGGGGDVGVASGMPEAAEPGSPIEGPQDTDAGSAARPEAASDRAVATAISAESSATAGAEDVPPVTPIEHEVPERTPPYASPSVRRLARELGVDLAGLDGTGRKGRIVPQDVRAAADGGAPATAPAAADAGTAAQAPAAQAAPAVLREGEERVPLTRIQQRSAANLAAAWAQIPLVTHHDEADITDLEAFRKQLNAEQADVKVTMVALLLKACAATLDAFPRFASSLDGDGLVVKPQRHIGFAADTPNGLVVPVVHDVERKGILALAAELTELSGAARAGKLAPKDMSGAVFTISSLGGIGGTGFTPLVNPPQVAILGVVRSATKPVWDGSQFVPRLMLPLSLSYDHRVIDGAAAARFTAHLARVLTDLRRVLL